MNVSIENILFRFGLFLAIGYQIYQVVNGLISEATTTLLNSVIAIFFGIILLMSLKVKNIKYVASFLHVAVIPVFIYFWLSFGGLTGTVPLILFVYTTWIILTLNGKLQIIILGLYLATFLTLTEFTSLSSALKPDAVEISKLQSSIDFFVVAVILIIFLVYLKYKFLSYLKRVEHRNKQLLNLNEILLKQTDKLQYSQEEIRSINENLEQIIDQRIKKIEERNKQLEEYAFINAHLVRGPLCRIIGLAVLMQQEEADPQLGAVHEKAQHVDTIIRRINEITR